MVNVAVNVDDETGEGVIDGVVVIVGVCVGVDEFVGVCVGVDEFVGV